MFSTRRVLRSDLFFELSRRLILVLRGNRGDGEAVVVLSEVAVDIVAAEDEARFRDLMQAHHYLGAVPGMGETVRYVAHHRG